VQTVPNLYMAASLWTHTWIDIIILRNQLVLCRNRASYQCYYSTRILKINGIVGGQNLQKAVHAMVRYALSTTAKQLFNFPRTTFPFEQNTVAKAGGSFVLAQDPRELY
jgi:hypothetical protein